MRLAGGESLRFMLYGAIAFPLLSMLLSARRPRLATVLGLVLVGLWTATCGVAGLRGSVASGLGVVCQNSADRDPK